MDDPWVESSSEYKRGSASSRRAKNEKRRSSYAGSRGSGSTSQGFADNDDETAELNERSRIVLPSDQRSPAFTSTGRGINVLGREGGGASTSV